MPPIEKTVVIPESTTGNFEADALKILEWMNGETPVETTPVQKTPAEEPKEETPKDTAVPKDGEIPKEEAKTVQANQEEIKVPLSRLNKEIDKRKEAETKFERLETKIKVEQDRIASLSEEEREEQENLQKLWMDTKLTRLLDEQENLNDTLAERDEKIKSLQEEIKWKETWQLAWRISELTDKYDGKNWLPIFDIKELIEYWNQKNFLPQDPLELYEYKYRAEIYAKQYNWKGTEVDKGNKETFTPTTPKPTFKDWDKDFEAEAKRILDSIGKTS